MKTFKKILFGILIFLLIFIGYFFIGFPSRAKEITWGINFSQQHTENLGLNWQNVYSALFEELKIKNIKLITHWNKIEKEKDNFNFNDLDWQIKKAENYGAKIILVIGMKTGRWPECHLPEWTKTLSRGEQQERILNLIKETVLRYKDAEAILAWQVENEPLFSFGECPWKDKNFLKKEIELVKSLDSSKKPIIISDSGEFSFWITSANLGNIVGITLYRKVWLKEWGLYVTYPLPPAYYWRKAQIIKKLFNKEVIVVELQAEPWCPNLLYSCSLKEQQKTMNLERFKEEISFAKNTGLNTFYLWGAEWWYWLKEKQNKPEIWEEAQKLFMR